MKMKETNKLLALLLGAAMALALVLGYPGIASMAADVDVDSSVYEATEEMPGLLPEEEEEQLYTPDSIQDTGAEDAVQQEIPEKKAGKKRSVGVSAKAESFLVTLTKSSFTYTGIEIVPAPSYVRVTTSDGTPVDSSNYSLTGQNNINAGAATLMVSGTGGYEGYVGTAPFTITPKSLLDTDVKASMSKTSYTWTGKEIKPAVKVVYKGKTLVKDTDYTVTYSNNINIGVATVTIRGKGNFTDTLTQMFSIAKLELKNSNTVVTLSSTQCTYNGKYRKPGVTVHYKKTKKLKKGRDYTVSYENNKNAGTAYVFITGKGDYTGGVQKTFKIKKASNNLKATITSKSIDINKTARISVSRHIGTLTYTSSNTTVAKVNNSGVITGKKQGNCTITVKAAGNNNYNSATVKFAIKVGNMDLSSNRCSVSLSKTHYIYDGTYKRPIPTVRFDGNVLRNNTDYTYTYYNNKNAGSPYVLITGKGKYTKSRKAYFTIEKSIQDNMRITLKDNRIPYNGIGTIKVTGAHGKVTYTPLSPSYTKPVANNSNQFRGLKKTQNYVTIVIKAAGDKNYYSKTVEFRVQVY